MAIRRIASSLSSCCLRAAVFLRSSNFWLLGTLRESMTQNRQPILPEYHSNFSLRSHLFRLPVFRRLLPCDSDFEGRVDYYYSIRSEGPELACRAEGPQPPEHTCVVALRLCVGKDHHQVASSTGNDQSEGTKGTPWTLTSRRCTLRRYVTQ